MKVKFNAVMQRGTWTIFPTVVLDFNYRSITVAGLFLPWAFGMDIDW